MVNQFLPRPPCCVDRFPATAMWLSLILRCHTVRSRNKQFHVRRILSYRPVFQSHGTAQYADRTPFEIRRTRIMTKCSAPRRMLRNGMSKLSWKARWWGELRHRFPHKSMLQLTIKLNILPKPVISIAKSNRAKAVTGQRPMPRSIRARATPALAEQIKPNS